MAYETALEFMMQVWAENAREKSRADGYDPEKGAVPLNIQCANAGIPVKRLKAERK